MNSIAHNSKSVQSESDINFALREFTANPTAKWGPAPTATKASRGIGGGIDIHDELLTRGILSAAAAMGWERLHGKDAGWRYPSPDAKGAMQMARLRYHPPIIRRGKQVKTLWMPGRKQKFGIDYYYSLEYLKSAIAAADGRVHIVNGEPAVLSMLAAGVLNALCWFGEVSVPKTLSQDLKKWGVRRAVYYADADEAGLTAAAKTAHRLSGSGIELEVRSLAGAVKDKGDVNDLWIANDFSAPRFVHALTQLSIVNFTAAADFHEAFDGDGGRATALAMGERYKDKEPIQRKSGKIANAGLAAAIVSEMRTANPQARENGGYLNSCHCPNPSHADKDPSASVNMKTGYIKCWSKCGTINPETAAEYLNIAIEPFIKRVEAPALYEVAPAHQHRFLYAPGTRGDGLDFVTSIDKEPRQWMTDALDHIPAGYTDVAFCAPKGMGKTVAISKMAGVHRKSGRSMLAISFLTENVRHAARVMDLDLYSELYVEAKRRHRKAKKQGKVNTAQPSYENLSYISPHIATTLNSLYQLQNAEGGINARDVLIIDELNEVVDALTGHLLNKRERTTFRLFIEAVKQAKFVIVSGADIRPLDLALIYSIRRRNQHLIDPIRPSAQPDSTQYRHRHRLIDAAINDARRGTVVMPIDSKAEAETIAGLAASRGIKKILIVHSEVANTDEVKAFLANPNGQSERYDLILYTTKISSGISIDVPVRAVYGLFGNAQIGAETASQMMHRVRNAERYGWHCHLSSSGRPRMDWRGYRNDWMANLADNGFEVDDVLERLADVAAQNRQWMGFSRHQKSDRMRQLELYQGHQRLMFDNRHPDESLTDTMKEIRVRVGEAKRERVINAEPVTPRELRKLAAAGDDMPEHHDGRLRDAIEQATGQEITSDLYDRYKSPTARLGLRNGRNQLKDTASLRDLDEAEQAENKPVHRRGNFVQRQAVANDLMRLLTGIDDFADAVDWLTDRANYIPAPILESKVTGWWTANAERVRRLFDIDQRSSAKPSAIVKLILRRVGLDITDKRAVFSQRMRKSPVLSSNGPLSRKLDSFVGQRIHFYGIDAAAASLWRADIEAQSAENGDESPAPEPDTGDPNGCPSDESPTNPQAGFIEVDDGQGNSYKIPF